MSSGDTIRPVEMPAATGPLRVADLLSGPWVIAALLFLAALPYLGVLHNDFTYVYDDKAQILDNPYVHSFSHLREIFTTSVWSFRGGYGANNYYRPFTLIVWLFCYRLFGPLAYGYHLVSLLLHLGAVLMVFQLSGRILRNRGAAWVAATLFALHPTHVESVAWISDMPDLLVTCFYLLTFWCFVQAGERRGRQRFWWQAAMTMSFVLALASKEPALTLPFLAAVYEFFYRQDRTHTTRTEKLQRQAALWIVLAAYLLVRAVFLRGVAHDSGVHALTLRDVFLSALASVGQYFSKLLWPVHLSAFYAFHLSSGLFQSGVLAGIFTLAVVALVFRLLWKRARPASFGILWIMVTLGPVLNARWMGAYVLADRYLYLPSVGFCLALGWMAAVAWRTVARKTAWRVAAVLAACLLATLGMLGIWRRVLDWRDDITLFSKSLVAEPEDYRLHDALGSAYWLRGMSSGAEREWRETLRLKPTHVQSLISLGALFAHEKRFDQAVPLLERALQLDSRNADGHLILGAALAETGDVLHAEEHLRAAVLLAPMNLNAHNLLGKLYYDDQRFDEAEQQFRQSLDCEPNVAAYDHLGFIYNQKGDRSSAEKAFRAALAINGMDSQAHFHLGLIYAAAGRNAEAAEELRAALAADPHSPEILSEIEKLRH